jgi:tetratricopeptide (TPR) repeat protein
MSSESERPRHDDEDYGAPGDTHSELSGSVYGPSVQARDVHGGIHVHQPETRLPTPSQLPAPGLLVDRKRDLGALEEARSGRLQSGVVLVSGPAGVGKTTLALHWAHAVREHFPDGHLFADMRGHAPGAPASTADVLGQFVRSFGVAPERVPERLAERAALFRSLTADRRIVVVLDDAISAAQVRPVLAASPGSVTVVTSRWRLAGLLAGGARGIQLDRLDMDAALELLTYTLGEDRTTADPDAVHQLAQLCAQLPLALSVAAARLATRPRWPVQEMVDALAHERRRLAALSVGDDMEVRAALDLSYRALPADAARVYRLLGLYPGTAFDSGMAAAAVALPGDDTRRLLGILIDANLLDDISGASGGRYRFHDLIRLHAAEMADRDDPETVRDEAFRRMLDWLLITAVAASEQVVPYRRDLARDVEYESAEPRVFAAAGEALNWLDEEFPNMLATVRAGVDRGQFIATWQLVSAVWPLFLYRGQYQQRLEFDQLGLEAARRSRDRRAEAKMLNRTGLALRDVGRLAEAAELFQEALAIWESLADDTRVASSLRRLGFIAMDRRQFGTASVHFSRALEIYRNLNDGRRTALTLNDLGAVLIQEGRATEAIGFLEEAGILLSNEPDPYNRGRVLLLLGRAHTSAGALDVAADRLRTALQSMGEIGSLPGQAEVLESFGDLALRAGRTDEAREHFQRALAILTQIGSPAEDRLRGRLEQLNT